MKKHNMLTGILAFASIGYSANCWDAEGIYVHTANLAIAMSYELGRLDALNDLTIQGDRLALSPEGQSRCVSKGGCPMIDELLTLQDDAIVNLIPINVFNPVIFRQRLVIQYQRQQIAAMRPVTDQNRAWIPNHTVALLGAENLGGCNPHFTFEVESLDQGVSVSASNLCSQLIFAGAQGMVSNGTCVAENPYLDIRLVGSSDLTAYKIDPQESAMNFGSNLLDFGCTYIDTQRNVSGEQCSCTDKMGSLMAVATGSNIYVCSSAK